MVRGRAWSRSAPRSPSCATTTCSSATATRSRRSGIGLLVLPRLPGHRRAGERRLPGGQDRPDPVPAGGVRQARDHHLPRELPARHGRRAGARAAAAAAAARARCCCSALPAAFVAARERSCSTSAPPETVLLAVFIVSLVAVMRERPSLKHFGPLLLVWGLAMLMLLVHPRPRQLADVLRRLPGAALRGHRRGSRSSASGATMFLGGATFFANNVSHVQERVDIWLDPFDARASVDERGLPDRPVAVRAGRRRAVRPGLRPGAARPPGRRDDPARRRTPT